MNEPLTNSPQTPRLRDRVRRPWLCAFVLMICFIWGNSLVPGDESGALSSGVLEMVQGMLAAVGLPWEWLTEFIVRKTAHFTEYMVLALVGMQAFRPHDKPVCPAAIALTAALLVAVPSCDETIQLFVGGRAGMVTDVLLDCTGALTGALLTLAACALRRRNETHRKCD